MTSVETRVANATTTEAMKKKSASTSGATVEAWVGNSGRSESMSSPLRRESDGRGTAVTARQNPDPQRDARRGRDAERAEDPQDGQPVAPRRRVVLVAEQKQGIDERPGLPFRRLRDREPQVARRILDAEEIARDAAVGRQDDQRARVGELAARRVVAIAEPDGGAEGVDGALLSREEPPALLRAGPVVALQVGRLLGRRERRVFPRIEAEGDGLESVAGPRSEALEAGEDAVQDHGADLRASVVHRREQDRL